MKRKNFIGRVLLVFCLFILIFLLASCSGKTNPYLPSVEIDVTLNPDGSADIREKHTVNFDRRFDDPWWNYYKSVDKYDKEAQGSKYSEISDVAIYLDGKRLDVLYNDLDPDDFTSRDKKLYANNGYVYERSDYYEVGVYMAEFNSGVKTIEMSYHLSNILCQYSDCTAFYYKFVDESNEMDYEKVTATVHFAEEISDELLVWTHIEYGNGYAVVPEGDKVSEVLFTAENLQAGEYFETRILLNNEYALNKYSNTTKEAVIMQEKKWYDDYQAKLKLLQTLNIIDYVVMSVVLVLTVLSLLFFIKKRQRLRLDNVPEYVREIPKGWTAGEMAPLYHHYGKYNVSDAISGTILDLFRKHYIEIKVGQKKKQAEITVLTRNISDLLPHEKTVYDMLSAVGGTFTMKQFENTAKANPDRFGKFIEDFKKESKAKVRREGLVNGENKDKYGHSMTAISAVTAVFGVIIMFFMFVSGMLAHISFAGLSFVVCAVAFLIAKKVQKQPLPDKGQQKYNEFHALGKFMSEFSNMDRHELPSLVLWGEYMVYATAMGIAEKVSEQLEIAYPEYKAMLSQGITDETRIFAILYFMSPRVRLGTGFVLNRSLNGICKSVVTMQRNAKILQSAKNVSSQIGRGGGFGHGGGGFSGGGGGFGGGGSHAR